MAGTNFGLLAIFILNLIVMKQFETSAFKMFIHDDLVKELIVKKNVTLENKDVQESMQLSLKAFPNTRFYVLMQGEENSAVSVDARRAAASEEYAKHSAALALCSDKLHLAIAGNLFLKVN